MSRMLLRLLSTALYPCVILSAAAQTYGDEIVLRPHFPIVTDAVQIDVPARACYMSTRTPAVTSYSLQVLGSEVTIEVEQRQPICFATGDPVVFKAVTLVAGPLPAGQYRISYTLRADGAVALQRTRQFEVRQHVAAVDQMERAFEYYHRGFRHFFFTAFAEEASALQAGRFPDWEFVHPFPADDQTQMHGLWKNDAAGRVPLHRLFSAAFAPRSTHFYTADEIELAKVMASPFWIYEGIAGYVLPPPAPGFTCPIGVPLYRFYNDGESGSPNHRYVTSSRLVAEMRERSQWTLEGVVACVPALGE